MDAGNVLSSPVSEVSQPAVEKDVVSEVLGMDDVEKMNKGAVSEGEKAALEGQSMEVVGDSSVAADLGFHESAVREGVAVSDYKTALLEGLEDNPQVPASVENPGISFEDKGAVDANQDNHVVLLAGGKEPGEGAMKDEGTEGVELIDTTTETNGVVGLAEETSGSGSHADHINHLSQSELLVEADGPKLSPEGDSVVGAIDGDVVAPGVAVVGETAEKEVVEEKERELPVSNGENLMTTADSSSALEADGAVETISADVVAPGVVVIGETGENKLTEVRERKLAVAHDETSVATCNSKFSVLEDNVNVSNDEVDKPNSEPLIGEDMEKAEQAPAEAENGEKLDTGGSVAASGTLNDPELADADNAGIKLKSEVEKPDASETKENGTAFKIEDDDEILDVDGVVSVESNGLVDGRSPESHSREYAQTTSLQEPQEILEQKAEHEMEEGAADNVDGSISDAETDDMVFGSSEATKQFIEELKRASGADGSHNISERIDGQIATDSDEEVDTDDEGEGKELFESDAITAFLKAATEAEAEGGRIRINSQDGSRLFTVERPAGLGSSIRSLRPATQPNRPTIFGSSALTNNGDADNNLSDEEKKKLESLQQIRVKFLRLVHRLGLSLDEHVVIQVLHRLALNAGRQNGQFFNIDTAKRTALQLEERQDDLDLSVSILIIGKCGVGKSATINSIFGEEKTVIGAFKPATDTVKEIVGFVDGVKIKVFDTPGLRCSMMEQAYNRRVLSSIKKVTQKNPPDVVLYVDRLDSQSRDLNDLPLLRTITSTLGPSILRSSIVTLTHAGCAPPEGGTSGTALNYDVFVSQRSLVVQQLIGNALNDLRMVSPNLMNPVSLVENHPSCRRNREGKKVLPNGMSWKPQLLLLCYSMKILSEANSVSKSQDLFDHRKLFGFRGRSPPLPYMLSSMLQSRAHPKLPSEQGGDIVDSDIDFDDLSDIDHDEEDEYDQLPPFRPLRKAQVARLSRAQKKAYFEEYDYRVKLLQKKQWMEELRRMKEMKTKGNNGRVDYGYTEEEADPGAAPVAVPLPDMVLPPSFDSDNPSYRYRILEPTSQFLARPVLDNLGWDHDCGYDGVNVEQSLAVANHYPAAVTVQVTKDKKDFTISLDSSVSAKHGENGSSMAGFDVQSIGKQLAYVVRGETKFKNLKKNNTAGGISVTFLGENVVPGVKIEDQIVLGKQYVLVGSAGAVRSQNDTALGANFEVQRRDQDFPIGQVQSTLSMSVIKWRGDLALGFNCLTQFSAGRGSKVTVRAGLNNKLSGQVTVKTSSSEHLSLALAAIVPAAISIYRKLWPGAGGDNKYSMY